MRWLTGCAVAVAIAGTGVMALADEDAPRLSVVGTGEVQVAPDMATVTLGVEMQEMTAEDASDAASRRMKEILIVLARAGVAPEDVQTTGLSLDPVYERARSDVNRAPRLLGFTARNTLRVTVRDLDGLGELLDMVIQGGANNFRGLSFGLQDPAMAQDAARREAVTDALAKAAVLAEAAGVRAGPILSLSEGSGGGGYRPEYGARLAMADAAVPVAPGSLTVSAQVSVVFEILQ